MSGPENLRGFDYQVSYSLLRVLEAIVENKSDITFQFESLNEEEEDFNIIDSNYTEFHQLKKRNEGNHWSPGDMKPIFANFISKDKNESKFFFITDGTANPELKKLRKNLSNPNVLEKEFLQQFLPENTSLENLKSLLLKLTILTRFFTSDDDTNPAKNLKQSIIEILSIQPFEIENEIDKVYSSLWKLVFDYSRKAAEVSIDSIRTEFEKCGIKIVDKPWAEIPRIIEFKGRIAELEIVSEKLNTTHKIVITGINGIGKTWFTSFFIEKFDPKTTCWLNCTIWTSIDHFIFLFRGLLHSLGKSNDAKSLQSLDGIDRIQKVLQLINTFSITIVIDSLNSSNAEFSSFVSEIVSNSLEKEISGNIIITSTKKIHGYNLIDVETEKISEYNLTGFSLEDTKEILRTISQDLTDAEMEEYHKAVVGHPMAIVFLKKLLRQNNISKEELIKLSGKSIEVARDWIIEKSISTLSLDSQQKLSKLSLLENGCSENEVNFCIESNLRPKYSLSELLHNKLISFIDENIYIHESIKEVASLMLSAENKLINHKEISDYYFSIMETITENDEGAPYEIIMKWGHQLEFLVNSKHLNNDFATVFKLSNSEIDCLWGIQRFGYPFDFETDDLSSSMELIESLLKKGLIEENNYEETTDVDLPFEYNVINLTYWQECLIMYICISRNLSYHLGYVLNLKPNHAWGMQNLCCKYEHCIEYMPLPPISKSDQISHSDFIKEQFNNGAYNDKTDEEIAFLKSMIDVEETVEDISQEQELELQESSCPVFGHCCPGGKEQAQKCRKQDEKSE